MMFEKGPVFLDLLPGSAPQNQLPRRSHREQSLLFDLLDKLAVFPLMPPRVPVEEETAVDAEQARVREPVARLLGIVPIGSEGNMVGKGNAGLCRGTAVAFQGTKCDAA